MIKDLVAYDGFEVGATQRVITPAGFLEAPANIARTGVQLYRARELGLDKYGIAGDQVVRLHRPDEELFNPNVISQFDGLPIINTANHTTVSADNWKDISVGDVRMPARNGNMLRVDKFVVRDKAAVDDVVSGKKYLSIGYTSDIDLTPGVNAAGEQYDGTQRNIRPNHVLITNSPRGGHVCAIADSTEEHREGKRTMKKITIDNIPVEVGDSEAGIIEKLIEQRDAARNAQPSVTYRVGDASKTITGGDAIVKEITDRDTKITELSAKVLAPEALDKLVNDRAAERTKVLGDALKLVPDFDVKDKTNKQIRLEVIEKVTAGDAASKTLVEATLNGKALGDASDEQLTVSFNVLSTSKVPARGNGADSAMAQALTSRREGGVKVGDQADKPSGRDAFIQRNNQAWRGAAATK